MTTVDSKSVGRFDQKLAAQRLFPSLSSWSPPSCLTQAQQLATRQLVPYIVRDGQWQCGIRPTAPCMTHPARRVMPNGPVGRKLQQFKCMSRAMHLPMSHVRGRGRGYPEYEPPAPPICLRGALERCLGVYDHG
jgi:hypothetical protein